MKFLGSASGVSYMPLRLAALTVENFGMGLTIYRALEGAVGQLQFIRVGLRKRGASTRLRLRWDRSPMTCAAVAKILPVEGQVFHAKYANNEIYFLTPMVDELPISEWRCLYPGPGDLLFLPIDSGHSANLVNNALAGNLPPMDLKRGILDFAFFYERGNSLIGPAGPSGGSLFATGTSFDEIEQVADAARNVWFHGAVGEVMYIIPD